METWAHAGMHFNLMKTLLQRGSAGNLILKVKAIQQISMSEGLAAGTDAADWGKIQAEFSTPPFHSTFRLTKIREMD